MEIKYINSRESFGMSGPWIGQLELNGNILKNEFLDDNYLKNEKGTLYVFNRFKYKNEGIRILLNLLKNYHNKREFQILIFDILNDKWFLSNRIFKSLFLTRIQNGMIYFTQAFHDNNRKLFPELGIEFNPENFTEVEKKEIIKNATQQRV